MTGEPSGERERQGDGGGPMHASAARIGPFLREHERDVLAEWERTVRAGEGGGVGRLSRAALADHVPELLHEIVEAIARGGRDDVATPTLVRLAESHAAERVEQGIDLWALVRELGLLRDAVLDVWEREARASADGAALRQVLRTFDLAVERVARRTAELQAKVGAAVETIATAALESNDLDAFLARLLDLLVASAPSVDSVAILLRDGESLAIHAARGLDRDVPRGVAIPIGDGFAGTIGATKQPLLLRGATHHPLVRGDSLHDGATKALFGVPLLDRGELVGVAYVGSRKVDEIPPAERRIFAAVAARATSVIVKQRLRDAIVQRSAEFEAVLRSIPDGVVVGNDRAITFFNGAIVDMLGVDWKDVEGGMNVVPVIVAARDPKTGAPIEKDEHPCIRALGGERGVRELLIQNHRTGADVCVRAVAAPIEVRGTILGAVAVFTDITETKTLERERETYVNAVIHDLRNPLGAMLASVQLTRAQLGTLDPKELERRLDRIEANTKAMSRLLGDLLDLSLAVSRRLPVHPEPLALAALVQERVALWKTETDAHDIRLDATEEIEALGDKVRIQEVLDNLLSNAIKYSPDGGSIVVSVERVGDQARVSVADHGVGLDEDERRRVLQPYVRTHTGAVRGHGLGLFICAELVRAHEGQLGVQSEPGKGSTFWFTLPLVGSTSQDGRPSGECATGS